MVVERVRLDEELQEQRSGLALRGTLHGVEGDGRVGDREAGGDGGGEEDEPP